MKASPTMLLKTNVEKMSPSAYPTMFMKTMDLFVRSHDVHENKGGYRLSAQWRRPLRQHTVDFDEVRAEFNPWQLWRLTLALANPRQGALRKNDIKMKVDPRMLLKTKDRMTQCPKNKAILCPKTQGNSEISANFARFFEILGDIVSNSRRENTVERFLRVGFSPLTRVRTTSKSWGFGLRELAPAFLVGSLLPDRSAPASRCAKSGSELPQSMIRPNRQSVIEQLWDFDVPLGGVPLSLTCH